jgi:hypothetical protein
MTKEKIAVVLENHARWLRGEGGNCASLVGARLDGARLIGARLDGASFVGACLNGARLDGARLIGARLDGASFVGARLIGARLDGASFVGARLDRASLVGATLDYARLDRARLDGASLERARLDGASFVGAKINNDKTAIGILRRATRSDGWEFFLWHCEDGFYIKVGCRFFTLEEGRQHWTAERAGTPLGDESLDILDFFAVAIKRAEAGK